MELQTILAPAAGNLKTPQDARRILATDCAEVPFGSYKGVKYAGNNTPDFVTMSDSRSAWNSRGVPDEYGLEGLPEALAAIGAILCPLQRTFVVSQSGDTPEMSRELFTITCASPARAAKLNASCFNKIVGNNQRAQLLANKPLLLKEHLDAMHSVPGRKKLQVKLPVYTDGSVRKEVCDLLVSYGDWVERVVACNTFGDCYPYEPSSADGEKLQPLIASEFAGGSGSFFFHTMALGQARRLRTELPPEMKITGVGGVSHGMHVKAFLKDDTCDRVGIGAHFYKYGEKCISEILSDM